MDQVKNGEKEYHLIEIMACRRGCIMGGGQRPEPVTETKITPCERSVQRR